MYILGHFALKTLERRIFSTPNCHILVAISLSFDLSHHLRNLKQFWAFYGHFSGTDQKSQFFASSKILKIKMAAILPNFEVRAPKLVYNPKIFMLLGVCGEKNQKTLLTPQKLGRTKVPPPQVQMSWLSHRYMEG